MKKIKYVGVIISLVLIILILYKINFQEVLDSFRKVNAFYLFPAILFYLGGFVIRALRWQILLDPLKKISLLAAFSVITITWMANNILPARTSELVRVYLSHHRDKISKSSLIATILVERILDGLTLVALLVLLVSFFKFPDWVNKLGVISALVFILATLFLLFLKQARHYIIGFIMKFPGFMPQLVKDKISRILTNFGKGLHIFVLGRHQASTMLSSTFVWLTEALTYCFVLLAFGYKLPFYAPLFILIIVNLGTLIPSSPGYIGTFQFFCILALSAFGISKNSALSYSVVLHALQYITISVVGMVFLHREGLKLSQLGKVR